MSDSMTTPPLPLTLPDGTPLPPPPKEAWRECTGSTLAKKHPESHAHAIELLLDGLTLSEIAEIIGPDMGKEGPGEIDGLRKIIRGWRKRAGIDPNEIAREMASDLRHETIANLRRNVANAKVRDIGPVAMALTQAHNVERSLGGLPTEIRETRKLTLADLEALRQPPPPRDITPIIDLDPTPTTP
jgi:hypothetical protein